MVSGLATPSSQELFVLFAVFAEDAVVPVAAIDVLAPLLELPHAPSKRDVRRTPLRTPAPR